MLLFFLSTSFFSLQLIRYIISLAFLCSHLKPGCDVYFLYEINSINILSYFTCCCSFHKLNLNFTFHLSFPFTYFFKFSLLNYQNLLMSQVLPAVLINYHHFMFLSSKSFILFHSHSWTYKKVFNISSSSPKVCSSKSVFIFHLFIFLVFF